MVTDPFDKPVDDLAAADFRVKVGGVPVPVITVEREPQPRRVAFLIDASGSMKRVYSRRPLVQRVAAEMVQYLSAQDEIGIFLFAESTVPVTHPTTERAKVFSALGTVPENVSRHHLNRTSIWDAVLFTIGQAGLGMGDALVLFTDGADNRSSSDFDSMMERLASIGVRAYVVLFDAGTYDDRSQYVADIAHSTGGDVVVEDSFLPGKLEDAKPHLVDLARRFATQIDIPYVLRFQAPRTTPGGRLNLEVRAVPRNRKLPPLYVRHPSRLPRCTDGENSRLPQ